MIRYNKHMKFLLCAAIVKNILYPKFALRRQESLPPQMEEVRKGFLTWSKKKRADRAIRPIVS